MRTELFENLPCLLIQVALVVLAFFLTYCSLKIFYYLFPKSRQHIHSETLQASVSVFQKGLSLAIYQHRIKRIATESKYEF